MANDRTREATFQALIDEGSLEIGDGYRAKNDELGGTGPIFLRAGHVSDTHIDFAGVERFHENLRDRLGQKFAMLGDTIVTTKGNSTGRTSFVTERMPEFVYSPHLSYWRSRNPKVINGGFLRYWSRGSEFIAQLRGMSASTDMAPYLSLTDQRRLNITLPPITRQERIADILGTLDDKIELNRRMNETLEAMARRLFKSWFVDFDPVHAKAALRREHPKLSNADLSRRALPNMAPEIAELFPDSFEDSTLGPIPKGWNVAKLCDHTEATRGLSYKGSGLSEAGMALHNLNSVFEGGGYKFEGIKFYSGDFQSRHRISPGDVIVANTEQGHDCLLLGYAAIVPDVFGNEGLFTHHLYHLRIRRTSPLTSDFLCRLINSPRMHEVVSGYGNGTTVNMLPIDGVQQPHVVVPPRELVVAFSELAASSRVHAAVLIEEDRRLAKTRDRLLPKLLSGELKTE
jgi:type I restriction enzyme S subunit